MRQQEKESRDGKQKWPVTICWDMEDANYQPCITIKSFVQSNPYGRTSEGNNVTICLDVSVNFGFFGRQTIELGCVELQDCDFLSALFSLRIWRRFTFANARFFVCSQNVVPSPAARAVVAAPTLGATAPVLREVLNAMWSTQVSATK
jgi:predicted protein tyrosine phosphatase